MSNKKRLPVTAETLLSELEQSEEFVQERREREVEHERRVKATRDDLEPMLAELRSAGFLVSEAGELLPRYSPLPRGAVEILLQWLPRLTDPAAQEMAVRALGATKERIEAEPLIRLYDSTDSAYLRWAIANTLSLVRSHGATTWVLQALADPSSGKAREMLALAVARLVPPADANRALLPLLREFPGHVAKALAQTGGAEEIVALKEMHHHTKGWQRTEIGRAIRTAEKRLAK